MYNSVINTDIIRKCTSSLTQDQYAFLQSQSLVAHLFIKIAETTSRIDWKIELIINYQVSHLFLIFI